MGGGTSTNTYKLSEYWHDASNDCMLIGYALSAAGVASATLGNPVAAGYFAGAAAAAFADAAAFEYYSMQLKKAGL